MDILSDNNLLLKLFVEFVSVDPVRQKSAPEKLLELEHSFGNKVYSDMLYLLTHSEFEPDEAREYWYSILEHRQELSRRLEREISFQVAVCDYFTHIQPKLQGLVLVEVNLLVQKERASLLDPFTGLYNRRFFERMLAKEVEQSRRHDQPFCLVALHVDNLEKYYQIHGRRHGDNALSDLAKTIVRTARSNDLVIRYGEEDFVMILSQIDADQGAIAAGRHCEAVSGQHFLGQENLPGGNLTVSIGLTAYPRDAGAGPALAERAFMAMNQAREEGGGRVRVWSKPGAENKNEPA